MNDSVNLYLAYGVNVDEAYWEISFTQSDNPVNIKDTKLLECYRKELVGIDAALEIKEAICSTLNILISDCNREGYSIDEFHHGFSHNIPLTVVENIFDFWLDIYHNHDVWQKCMGLLRIRKRLNFPMNILLNNLKGNSYKYASRLEKLLCYRPVSFRKEITNNKKLMW